MLSLRLSCILVLGGALTIGAVAACTQQAAATPSARGDDDDSSGDDDDSAPAKKSDAGSSGNTSGSSGTSGTSGSPPEPVDSGPPPKSTMTFFITSKPAGVGGTPSGNLGGLTGADKTCQDLATAASGGDHTWKAFLGTQNPAANPKDRIGKGPWVNQKGVVVATDLDSLLDAVLRPLGDSVFMDEKGAAIPDTGQYILTGSLPDGTPTQNNCKNWTDDTQNSAGRYGLVYPSRNPNAGANWAFAKGQVVNTNSNCTANGLKQAQSEGRIACFATD